MFLFRRYIRSTDGNFSVMLVGLMIPLALMMGLAVDFGTGSLARSDMQNALDSATMSVIGMPVGATRAQRQARLQEVYQANGGLGTAALVGDISVVNKLASLSTTASHDNPNTFMRLGGKNITKVTVNAQASKPARLISASFRVTNVMGWWNKKVTLYGRKTSETTSKPLVDITYVWNGIIGDGAGVGNVTMRRFNNGSPVTAMQRTCLSALLSACVTTGGDAMVDVSDMDDVYLTMQTSASVSGAESMIRKYCSTYPNCTTFPLLLSTKDPSTSNRLFVNGVQQPDNTSLSINQIVPCDQWSTQAWEDGGSYKEKGPYSGKTAAKDADFFYEVQGKCGLAAGTEGARMTQ